MFFLIERCALVVRLGHDCCSFAASAAAAWAAAGGGRRLVVRLERNARARDCVPCVVRSARAHLLDVLVIKDGRLRAAVQPQDGAVGLTVQVNTAPSKRSLIKDFFNNNYQNKQTRLKCLGSSEIF